QDGKTVSPEKTNHSGNLAIVAISGKHRPDHPFGKQKSNRPSDKSQQFYKNYFKKLSLRSDYNKNKRNGMITCPMNRLVDFAAGRRDLFPPQKNRSAAVPTKPFFQLPAP
ncbi:MAG: hypothetical protein Q4F08_08000, partial [Rikenellaceae bacterium]|nr:hypothetical protein [Rikenellaceae bacterium]